jgi:peptidoglycan/xylan/chitin deacetylase (PgdA/CDA1 family)
VRPSWAGGARRLAKTGLACALSWTGVDRMIGALNGSLREPLVIGYHGVVEDVRDHAETAIPAILTSRATLEKHLDWIGRRRRFVSLDALGERLSTGERRGQPVAAVTFDDGYANVYEHALPVLRRKGIPAAIFVVTDLVGTPRPQLHDHLHLLLMRAYKAWRRAPRELGRLLGLLGLRLPWVESEGTESASPLSAMQALLRDLPQRDVRRVIQALQGEVEVAERDLSRLRPVTWEMLAEMRRAGFTIGSHTRSHALLTQEGPARVLEEIKGSRQELERRLGGTVDHFAYPGGRFDRAAIRAVRGAGYRYAYTACGHRDPSDRMMTIPRRLLWEHACRNALGRFSPAILGCQVHGVFDAASRCRMDHGAERSAA